MAQQRQTANKVSIGMVMSGELFLTDDRFDYVEILGKRIAKISIVANVVEKYVSDAKPYGSLTLDDGTGQIRAKFFDKLDMISNINIGDTILVIGWLRYFNEELYIIPDLVRKMDVQWIFARKLELERDYGKDIMLMQQPEEQAEPLFPQFEKQKEIQNDNVNEDNFKEAKEEKIESNEGAKQEKGEHSIKNDILKIVSENAEGIDIDKVIMSLNYPVAEISTAITELIDENKIYEPQPGRVRAI